MPGAILSQTQRPPSRQEPTMPALSPDRARMHRSIALATGVPFAVLWGGWFVLTGSGGASPAALAARAAVGVLAGVLFGCAMSAILGSWQWRAAVTARDTARDGRATVAIGTHAVRDLVVAAPAAEILRRGADAAAVLGRARVTTVDEATGTVELSVPASWRSWGERVRIVAGRPDATGTTSVTVESRPVLSWTIVDYGRNAGNADRVANWLRGLPG